MKLTYCNLLLNIELQPTKYLFVAPNKVGILIFTIEHIIFKFTYIILYTTNKYYVFLFKSINLTKYGIYTELV